MTSAEFRPGENLFETDGESIEKYIAPMDEVRALAWNLGYLVGQSSFEINQVIGITRGGLTPTDCVSRALEVRDIQTLAVDVYRQNPNYGPGDPREEIPRKRVNVLRKPILNDPSGRGAVFVDDIVDTGKTLSYVRRKYPEAATVAVYTKKIHRQSSKYVDFYGKYVGNIWVQFPWETEAESIRKLKSAHPYLFN